MGFNWYLDIIWTMDTQKYQTQCNRIIQAESGVYVCALFWNCFFQIRYHFDFDSFCFNLFKVSWIFKVFFSQNRFAFSYFLDSLWIFILSSLLLSLFLSSAFQSKHVANANESSMNVIVIKRMDSTRHVGAVYAWPWPFSWNHIISV